MKRKYRSLRELVLAYDKNEVSEKNCPLIISNNQTVVYQDGKLVYEGGTPADLLKTCLTLLGVPWQDAERETEN